MINHTASLTACIFRSCIFIFTPVLLCCSVLVLFFGILLFNKLLIQIIAVYAIAVLLYTVKLFLCFNYTAVINK